MKRTYIIAAVIILFWACAYMFKDYFANPNTNNAEETITPALQKANEDSMFVTVMLNDNVSKTFNYKFNCGRIDEKSNIINDIQSYTNIVIKTEMRIAAHNYSSKNFNFDQYCNEVRLAVREKCVDNGIMLNNFMVVEK